MLEMSAEHTRPIREVLQYVYPLMGSLSVRPDRFDIYLATHACPDERFNYPCVKSLSISTISRRDQVDEVRRLGGKHGGKASVRIEKNDNGGSVRVAGNTNAK